MIKTQLKEIDEVSCKHCGNGDAQRFQCLRKIMELNYKGRRGNLKVFTNVSKVLDLKFRNV